MTLLPVPRGEPKDSGRPLVIFMNEAAAYLEPQLPLILRVPARSAAHDMAPLELSNRTKEDR